MIIEKTFMGKRSGGENYYEDSLLNQEQTENRLLPAPEENITIS